MSGVRRWLGGSSVATLRWLLQQQAFSRLEPAGEKSGRRTFSSRVSVLEGEPGSLVGVFL